MTTPNQEQAEYWNSSEQADRWVAHQDRHDRMLAPFTGLIFRAAALAPGDQVLDVGCGCGTTSLEAARTVAPGTVTGIDLSAAMLARARQTAARSGLTNASFVQGDAQAHRFEPAFDAVISRFGVMFFADPVAAFANLRTAARPGGRLSFACWQPFTANEWLTLPVAALAEHVPIPDLGDQDGPGMFGLADPGRIRAVLTGAGWHAISVTAERVPILVGGGTVDEAVTFLRSGSMGRQILDGADEATQARALGAVRAVLASRAVQDQVHLDGAVWIVRAENR